MNYLKQKGIATGVHYIPNHMQPFFAETRVSLPVTEKLFDEIITLPLYYEMTHLDVDSVIEAIRTFFEKD